MKRRKAKSPAPPTRPEEADASNANEAISCGHEAPAGQYVGDLAEVLSVLAGLLDPTDKKEQGLQLQFVGQSNQRRVPSKKKPTSPEEDADWEGNLLQVKEAIENGNAVAVSWYLGDAADLLNRLAAILNGQSGSEDRRLKFHRKRAGKPSDPSKTLTDAAIVRELELALSRGVPKKVAIADLAAKRGISRSTIYRALKQYNSREKKSHN